ncbi:hypothetical protein BGZ63DRAFT_426443 [Mariannaea sp. PMI_226]|nr:hypothetical protein BGZ63DRAFT_426443 [Mariannaea sp. PMI_226]
MEDSDFLTSAISTLTLGWYGNADGRHELTVRGRHEYVRTLSSLRKALPNAGKSAPYDLELLAAIELLAHYEMYEFGGRSSHGWMAHLAGAENILRLNCDETQVSETYLDILLSHRLISVVSALSSRRRISLPTMAKSRSPALKDKFPELLDIGVKIAEFLEDMDSILEMPPFQVLPEHHSQLPSRCVSLIKDLASWRKSLGVRSQLSPHLPSPSAEDARQPSDSKAITLYPSKSPQFLGIPFDELQLARLLHLYSSMLLTTHLTILRVETKYSESSFQSPLGDILPERAERISEAVEQADFITAWADVCIQSAWQSFGPVIGTFSLGVVLDWYRFEERITAMASLGVGQQRRELNVIECSRLLKRLRGEDAKPAKCRSSPLQTHQQVYDSL